MLSAKERNGKMGMPLKPSSFSLSFFFFFFLCVCVLWLLPYASFRFVILPSL